MAIKGSKKSENSQDKQFDKITNDAKNKKNALEKGAEKSQVKKSDAKSSQSIKTKSANKDGLKFFNDIVDFLEEVRVEYRKIEWPSRPQVFQETWSVLVLVAMVTLFVLASDWVLSHAFFMPLDSWARMHGGGIGLK